MVKLAWFIVIAGLLTACSHTRQPSGSVYQDIGGLPVIYTITDHFITRIEQEPQILEYFKGTDIGRFRTHFTQQLCTETGGPCQYEGESMQVIHQGMNINEADFNRTVELLIEAMREAGLSYPLRNKILAKLAPMRAQMLYQ